MCGGGQSSHVSVCKDRYSNCESLANKYGCPADCEMTDKDDLCGGCKTTCKTCENAGFTKPNLFFDGLNRNVRFKMIAGEQ